MQRGSEKHRKAREQHGLKDNAANRENMREDIDASQEGMQRLGEASGDDGATSPADQHV